MHLNVTLIGRAIAHAALEQHKEMCNQTAALLRRLERSEAGPKEALGTNGYLQGVFDAIPQDQTGTVTIELASPASAKELKIALVLWTASVTKKAQNLLQTTLETDVDEKKEHAQLMMTQLAEQLSLPVTDINALAHQNVEAGKTVKPKAEPAAEPEPAPAS